MVCIAAACPAPRWHRVFLAMLPAIVVHAKYAFRHLRGEARQDAIQETIANSLVAFKALVRRGRMSIAYPTVLAKYAVAQINDGRCVGNSLNVREVLSPYAQKQKGFKVERLDQYSEEDQSWSQALVEDKTAGPAEIACSRIDIDAWFHALPRRHRRIAQYLSLGNRTSKAASRFGLSQGRISQIRAALERSWRDYTGGNEGNAA